MTKKEMFELIATVNAENTEIVDFCKHEIELLANKAKSRTSAPTKKQIENESFKKNILNILEEANKPLTISEMMTYPELGNLTNQRVSALVTQLKKDEKIVRFEEKRKAYFCLPE